MKLIPLVQSLLTNSLVHLEFCFLWNQTLVTCPTPVLWLNCQTTTWGQTITMIITDKFRLPFLIGDPGGIRLESNIDRRRGDRDQPLHPPLQLLHLQTLERESRKDLNIPIRRQERDIHLLLLLPQYHIVRYMTMADTKEVDIAHRQYRTRKFYSLRKYLLSRQWHLNRPCLALQGIQVPTSRWKLGPLTGQSMRFLGFCLQSYVQGLPRSILARPLSGIEQLMESQSLFYKEEKIYMEFNYFFFFFLSFHMLAVRISMQSRKLGRYKKAVADPLCFPLILRT